MGVSFVEGILVGSRILIIAFNGVMSFTGALLFYLSRFKGIFEPLRYVMIVFLNAFLIFYWYYLSGVFGPTSPGAIAVGTVSIIIARSNHRIYVFAIFSVILTFLALSQWLTDWVQIDVVIYDTIFIDYAIFGVSALLIINYLKSKFDLERKVIRTKNEELEQLNNKLKETIAEKDFAIKELKRTQHQLIESEKLASIGKLTAGIAHELNNPLNYVGGSVQPMRRNLDELKGLVADSKIKSSPELFEELDLLMNNVGQGTERAKIIIDKLGILLPDKLENGNTEIEKFQLGDIIEPYIKDINEEYPEVVFKYHIEKPYQVTVDPGDLRVILSNIISNGIQSVPKGSTAKIHIDIFTYAEKVAIQVADNGSGIEKSDLLKVQDPFFTTKGVGGGKGLGMFVVYNLVKLHNGEIEIESEIGVGTTVKVMLPFLSI